MTPITHPLAIAYVEAMASTGDDVIEACVAWHKAGRPLYADPGPMPAPALGMRAWCTAPNLGTMPGTKLRQYDVEYIEPGERWADHVGERDIIDLITDFRTGEVLWRRS